jgi:hypothetical protein
MKVTAEFQKILVEAFNRVFQQTNKQTHKQTACSLIRKRTIPTERPQLVDEI